MTELCRSCVKDTLWRDNVLSADFNEYMNVADEAFVWLLMENYGGMWYDEFHGKYTELDWNNKNAERKAAGLPDLGRCEKARDAKFSNGGRGSKKQGWSKEGRAQFKVLGMSVMVNRRIC